jgi:hypothetical protein
MRFNRGLNYEDLYESYYNENKEDLINSYIDDFLEFYEDEVNDIMLENNFTTIKQVRDYLYNSYDYETFKDIIEDEVDKQLQDIYDKSFDIVKSTTKNIIDKFNNLIDDKAYLSYKINVSRSWNAGKFPSIYFIIDDSYDELTIRLSDLHDNGRNDSDIELNWYDLDIKSYKEQLVDSICELLNCDYDIEISFKDFQKLCDSKKIKDTGRADTLEETIMAIANKQYKKHSPLHLNLSQKQLDKLINDITYSDDLVKLVNKYVKDIE